MTFDFQRAIKKPVGFFCSSTGFMKLYVKLVLHFIPTRRTEQALETATILDTKTLAEVARALRHSHCSVMFAIQHLFSVLRVFYSVQFQLHVYLIILYKRKINFNTYNMTRFPKISTYMPKLFSQKTKFIHHRAHLVGECLAEFLELVEVIGEVLLP